MNGAEMFNVSSPAPDRRPFRTNPMGCLYYVCRAHLTRPIFQFYCAHQVRLTDYFDFALRANQAARFDFALRAIRHVLPLPDHVDPQGYRPFLRKRSFLYDPAPAESLSGESARTAAPACQRKCR